MTLSDSGLAVRWLLKHETQWYVQNTLYQCHSLLLSLLDFQARFNS
jgi:hypothetical protein